MNRWRNFGGGLGVGMVVCAALATPARGDEGDPIAKRLLTAAEKHSELQDVTARYGQRAEIAQQILQGQAARIELHAQIREMNAEMSGYPQNRRQWLPHQWAIHDQKVESDRQLTALDRQLETLKLEEHRMYEQELQEARAEKRRVRPLNREALLNDLQRLERERDEAVVGLKDDIETAAREKRTTPRQVLDGALGRLDSLKTEKSPDVERDFLPKFIRFAGGDAWLDREKVPAAKQKKVASRSKKGTVPSKKNAPQARKAIGF